MNFIMRGQQISILQRIGSKHQVLQFSNEFSKIISDSENYSHSNVILIHVQRYMLAYS